MASSPGPTTPVYSPSQLMQMQARGAVLPPSFTVLEENGKKTNFSLLPGARITKPENPAITSPIRAALATLADLTEYYELGGAPAEDLSGMINRGDAFFMEHDARLRGLVKERCDQLRAWLKTPDRPMRFGVDYKNMKSCPAGVDREEWLEEKREGKRAHSLRIMQASNCLCDLDAWK